MATTARPKALGVMAAQQHKTDLTDDAIVTAVVGRIAGKFPTLDMAQLTGQTRKGA